MKKEGLCFEKMLTYLKANKEKVIVNKLTEYIDLCDYFEDNDGNIRPLQNSSQLLIP